MNWTNLIENEPVQSSSHSDNEENIGQISSVEQQKLHQCLEWTQRDTEGHIGNN